MDFHSHTLRKRDGKNMKIHHFSVDQLLLPRGMLADAMPAGSVPWCSGWFVGIRGDPWSLSPRNAYIGILGSMTCVWPPGTSHLSIMYSHMFFGLNLRLSDTWTFVTLLKWHSIKTEARLWRAGWVLHPFVSALEFPLLANHHKPPFRGLPGGSSHLVSRLYP